MSIPMPMARFGQTTTCVGGGSPCCACTTTSRLARLVAQQPLWSHLLIGLLDHDPDLDPIHLDVEVDPQPATNAAIRRTEEPPRIGFNHHLPRPSRSPPPP